MDIPISSRDILRVSWGYPQDILRKLGYQDIVEVHPGCPEDVLVLSGKVPKYSGSYIHGRIFLLNEHVSCERQRGYSRTERRGDTYDSPAYSKEHNARDDGEDESDAGRHDGRQIVVDAVTTWKKRYSQFSCFCGRICSILEPMFTCYLLLNSYVNWQTQWTELI